MENKHRIPFSLTGVIISIGIVFGDIGTSPLYVMRVILNTLPDSQLTRPEYILGAVSCVIWTLTLQTTLKYVVITLRADNNGEGGILALYALIRQKFGWAFVIAIFGAATLLADGVITPAITVISAIEGLNASIPAVPVIPLTIVIVLLLFMIQPLGSGSLGRYFGIVMVCWFGMMAVVGGVNLSNNLSVLQAFNPMMAIRFLAEAPQMLMILSAIFLCTTGAEALYSDLGHCGLKNIRVSWVFVKIALMVNYLGQAAWILNHPQSVSPEINPFFEMMPSGFRLAGVGIATLAAIIASQALISGSFTVISEAISLNLWPNVIIKYPAKSKGQMYIPSINHIMMALCILIIIMFQSSLRLEAAYGLAITLSMLMTTFLLYLYFEKNSVPKFLSLPLTCFFATVEITFFMANMLKFRHGGYMPIAIAGFLATVMYSWFTGRRIKREYTVYDQLDDNYLNQIVRISEDESIPKFATNLIYIVKANKTHFLESKITYSLFKNTPKRADTYWFVRVKRTDQPYEFSFSKIVLVPRKIFRIDMNVGFKVDIHTDQYVRLITLKLEKEGLVDLSSRYPSMQNRKDTSGDYKFMVVDRIFRNVEMTFKQQLIFSCYNLIKRFSTSDTQIYDIDPTLAYVEFVPITERSASSDILTELISRSRSENS